MKKRVGTVVFAVIFLLAVFFLGYFVGTTRPSEPAAMVIFDAGDPNTVLPEGQWEPSYGPANRLNLNEATSEDLQLLPGIGPKLAERIVEYRETNGAFESAEELLNVEGIGQSVFGNIRHLIDAGGTQ